MPIEFYRDGPWELPEGWVWARLGDACQINRPPSLDDLPDGLEIPFVPMAAVAEETGVVDLSQRKRVSELRSGYTRFQSGDVLFAKITPCMENGKSAPLPDIPGGYGAGSTEFHTLRSQALDARYLWYWLVRRAFRADAQRNMRGAVGQLRVPLDYLRETPIAIAPSAEQRRIVARIDELFTEIADGETSLTRARDDLDTWRRALLKAAVTGELTREWREKHQPNETGDVLLRNIRASKRGKSRAGLQSEELEPIDLPEIPSSWTWGTMGDGLAAAEYGTSEKCDSNSSGLPVLRMGNIQDGEITFDSLKYLPSTHASDVPLLDAGDILFNRTNSEELVGKSAVVSYLPRPTSFASYLIRLKAEQGIEPYFIVAWLNSAFGRRWIRANKSQQVGQANLSGGKLRWMPMPFPPTAEQAEVKERLLEIKQFLSDQETDIGSSQRLAAGGRQSILKAAFEGWLVEQDPRDEPAERLLARLSEQNGQPAQSRSRKPPRRAPTPAE